MNTFKFFALASLSFATAGVTVEVTTITQIFQASGGVTVAPNGDIFVADYGAATVNPNGDKVFRVTDDGQINTYATGLNSASGNVIGPDGALYQSSYVRNRIYKINADGSLQSYARGPELFGPVGLEFDSKGDLYIANCNNNTIAKQTQGNLTTYIDSSLLSCPAGLAIDEDDNLYVTNYGNGHILKVTPDAQVSILATTDGGETKPNGSNAHITYGNGQLYLVSSATHQVFSLSLTGELQVIAGTGERGNVDGAGSEAQFALPNGIDISADGSTLYVNNSTVIGNDSQVAPNVLRKISLDDESNFDINVGLAGAWYEQITDGSGMFIDVIENQKQLLISWFTWAVEPDSKNRMVGSSQQRWINALGSYSGHQASLTMYRSEGGVFDQSVPVNTEEAGSMQINFNDCLSATLTYDFTDGPKGEINLERLTPDQLCQMINN